MNYCLRLLRTFQNVSGATQDSFSDSVIDFVADAELQQTGGQCN